MKKVAFVCYFFAPHNDAGTFRSVRFAERLLAHNYLPEVYSITEDSIKKFGGKLDHTIGVNLSKEIIINQIIMNFIEGIIFAQHIVKMMFKIYIFDKT